MTAPDQQIAYISSLEKELSESAESLKLKRRAREKGLAKITDLREEQVRLQQQLSRLQARQELAARLDGLVQQIEAKKKEKADVVNSMKASVETNQEGETEEPANDKVKSDAIGQVLGRFFGKAHTNYNSAQNYMETNDDNASGFSLPETRSVYEGFEFRDEDLKSGESRSQSLLSTGSSSAGASSYCLPFSYSPALRSAKERNQKLEQQLARHSDNSMSTSVQSVSSTFSPPLLWEPPRTSSVKMKHGQIHQADTSTSVSSTFTPPLKWQPSASSLAGSLNRDNGSKSGCGTSVAAASSTTFSSISSTFSPPLVWEHSTSHPKSPGDFLLNNKKPLPSMLDAMLHSSPAMKHPKQKVQFT